VRARLYAAEIARITELRDAAFERLMGAARERCEMVERGNAELVDELHDFRISLGELKAHTLLHAAISLGILPSDAEGEKIDNPHGSELPIRQLPECLPVLAGFCFGCAFSLTASQLSGINTRAAYSSLPPNATSIRAAFKLHFRRLELHTP